MLKFTSMGFIFTAFFGLTTTHLYSMHLDFHKLERDAKKATSNAQKNITKAQAAAQVIGAEIKETSAVLAVAGTVTGNQNITKASADLSQVSNVLTATSATSALHAAETLAVSVDPHLQGAVDRINTNISQANAIINDAKTIGSILKGTTPTPITIASQK